MITTAIDPPTINSPPTSTRTTSATRMFRSSRNSATTSIHDLRGGGDCRLSLCESFAPDGAAASGGWDVRDCRLSLCESFATDGAAAGGGWDVWDEAVACGEAESVASRHGTGGAGKSGAEAVAGLGSSTTSAATISAPAARESGSARR